VWQTDCPEQEVRLAHYLPACQLPTDLFCLWQRKWKLPPLCLSHKEAYLLLMQEKIGETGYKLTGGSVLSSGNVSPSAGNEKTGRKLQRLDKRLLIRLHSKSLTSNATPVQIPRTNVQKDGCSSSLTAMPQVRSRKWRREATR
jgi:hypothetical protein